MFPTNNPSAALLNDEEPNVSTIHSWAALSRFTLGDQVVQDRRPDIPLTVTEVRWRTDNHTGGKLVVGYAVREPGGTILEINETQALQRWVEREPLKIGDVVRHDRAGLLGQVVRYRVVSEPFDYDEKLYVAVIRDTYGNDDPDPIVLRVSQLMHADDRRHD